MSLYGLPSKEDLTHRWYIPQEYGETLWLADTYSLKISMRLLIERFECSSRITNRFGLDDISHKRKRSDITLEGIQKDLKNSWQIELTQSAIIGLFILKLISLLSQNKLPAILRSKESADPIKVANLIELTRCELPKLMPKLLSKS